jgi:hypothetical protein
MFYYFFKGFTLNEHCKLILTGTGCGTGAFVVISAKK